MADLRQQNKRRRLKCASGTACLFAVVTALRRGFLPAVFAGLDEPGFVEGRIICLKDIAESHDYLVPFKVVVEIRCAYRMGNGLEVLFGYHVVLSP